MRKRIILSFVAALIALMANAQTSVKKVYNEDINPLEQIDVAVIEGSF